MLPTASSANKADQGVRVCTALLRVILTITSSAALTVTALATPAGAKVSGPNGQIVFTRFGKALGEGAPAARAKLNGRIVFRRYLNDSHTIGAIYTIKADGTGLFRVTRAPRNAVSTEPDPSPSGRWIDYMVEWPNNPAARSKIFKIRPDGSGRTNLSASCTGICQGDGFPDWSHTSWIAFQRVLSANFSQPVGFTAIFVMRPDGTHVHQITQRSANPAKPARFDDLAPAWSPDGQQIAFERVNDASGHHAIFTVGADGQGLRRITPWRLDASQPQYSPDGRWICLRSNEPSGTSGNIFLIHSDGTGLRQLTHTPAGTGKWLSCAFSPNGRYVVSAKTLIVSGHQQNADVFIIPAGGGPSVDVTEDPDHWDSAPDWGLGRA
jgi:Tol biopolymer transport system component